MMNSDEIYRDEMGEEWEFKEGDELVRIGEGREQYPRTVIVSGRVEPILQYLIWGLKEYSLSILKDEVERDYVRVDDIGEDD